MRPISHTRSASALAWPDPLRFVRQIFANRRTVGALSALDDRQLADIGLPGSTSNGRAVFRSPPTRPPNWSDTCAAGRTCGSSGRGRIHDGHAR